MSRIAVYAIGGNALSSPNPEKEDKSAEVLAHVMSDVIDLLELGLILVVDLVQQFVAAFLQLE